MATVGEIMFDWAKFIILAKILFKRLDEESICMQLAGSIMECLE